MKRVKVQDDCEFSFSDNSAGMEFETLFRKNTIKYYKFLHPEWTHQLRNIEIMMLKEGLKGKKTILEIGSGDGYVAGLLNDRYGLNINATDIEPRYPSFTNVTKIKDGILPYKDQSVDAIISFHVLEHVEEIDVVLQEMHRVLKPDGEMFHVVPATNIMIFSCILQPLAYLRTFYLYLSGFYGSELKPFTFKNLARFFKRLIRRINPINIFWGAGHGKYGRLGCIKYWKVNHWMNVFRRNDWNVNDIKYSGISYSMHKIFPNRFMYLRQMLAKRGWYSANLFVVSKSSSNEFSHSD